MYQTPSNVLFSIDCFRLIAHKVYKLVVVIFLFFLQPNPENLLEEALALALR